MESEVVVGLRSVGCPDPVVTMAQNKGLSLNTLYALLAAIKEHVPDLQKVASDIVHAYGSGGIYRVLLALVADAPILKDAVADFLEAIQTP